ncbi:hypothetical protein J6590_012949 [Homalodisca vitripennis]|nr:hypothetical protein J6590_012949 [Homalodisca vitripennis]
MTYNAEIVKEVAFIVCVSAAILGMEWLCSRWRDRPPSDNLRDQGVMADLPPPPPPPSLQGEPFPIVMYPRSRTDQRRHDSSCCDPYHAPLCRQIKGKRSFQIWIQIRRRVDTVQGLAYGTDKNNGHRPLYPSAPCDITSATLFYATVDYTLVFTILSLIQVASTFKQPSSPVITAVLSQYSLEAICSLLKKRWRESDVTGLYFLLPKKSPLSPKSGLCLVRLGSNQLPPNKKSHDKTEIWESSRKPVGVIFHTTR